MRKAYLLLLSFIVLFACKKETAEKIDEKIKACFNYSPSDKIQVGDTIWFECCENDSLSYFWDFGDGKSSNQKNPFHIYTMSDSFKVNLIVKKNNMRDSIAKYVMVLKKEEKKIKACFNYSPSDKIKVGDTIWFECCESDSLSYFWDFGDGKSSNQENPFHIYTMSDSFKVNLIVKKNDMMDSIAKYVMVLKKEERKYDTIYPLQYFPAFPGSYWIYSNGKSLQMEEQYQIFYYNKEHWGVKPVYDTIYLPKFKINSIYGYSQSYVYGYEISTGTFRLPFRTILSEVPSTFQTGEIFGGNASYGKTIKQDTTVVINGVKFENVLIVINYNWNQNIGNLPWNIREYYAKYVGLIKRESRNIGKPEITTVDFELISYKINR